MRCGMVGRPIEITMRGIIFAYGGYGALHLFNLYMSC